MARFDVRFRKEPFGFTLAFRDGDIGFYDGRVAAALAAGSTKSQLEPFRLQRLPVTERFHLSAPLIVWFEITRACNLPCKHCYVEAGARRAHELSTAEVFDVLEQLAAAGVFAVVLVGGEPMARKDFHQILDKAHELGFVISIATNGTYITQEVIDRLPREECIVSISVDGTRFHKEMRVLSEYGDIREKLLLLKQNRIPAAIMATQTDRNTAELREVFAFAREHGFFFGTTPFSPIGRGAAFPQFLPTADAVEPAAQLYIEDKRHDMAMMDTVGLCVAKFLDQCHRVAQMTRREFCGVAMAYILSDGTVYPCSICASRSKFRAANLRESTFKTIWETGFDEIRDITFDSFSDCGTCELSKDPYYCSSRCAVMAEVYTGRPDGCGSNDFVKGSLKRRTELLVEEGILE